MLYSTLKFTTTELSAMSPRHTHPLKSLLHPCIFVLKEGGKIKKDFLDYSLMILFTHSREIIRSPLVDDSGNAHAKDHG